MDTLWIGGAGGMEADLVQRAGIPFRAIPAAGLHGVGLRALPGNLGRLGRGYLAARRILAEFDPQALFFTGGYVAPPVAVAGRSRPAAMFVPDIEPGLALKTVARFVDRVAVTVEDSRVFFTGRPGVQVTGYPTRPELAAWTPAEAHRAKARAEFDLAPDRPALLVVGGSSGARSINLAVLAVLEELLAEMQVIHLVGRLDWETVQSRLAALPEPRKAGYRPFMYLHERMGAAFCAADLAVSRAGASTLGEFPLFGLPAILVPYPYAWRYQQTNARYLEARGAAELLPDEALGAELLPRVRALVRDEARRTALGRAMRALAVPGAAGSIAGLLQDLAGEGAAQKGRRTRPGKGGGS